MPFSRMLALAVAALVAGCSNHKAAGAAPAQGTMDEVTGLVQSTSTGATTTLSLKTADGSLFLAGPPTYELHQLHGVRVTVRGVPRPPRAFEVASYRILDVNGKPAVTGRLVVKEGVTWLAGTDTLRLVGAPAALAGMGGAKVWVVGERKDRDLTVQSYGVINEAPSGH